MATNQRIHFLDSLRGITIIHMVLFHFCYDLVFFCGLHIPGYTGWPGNLWGSYIRWSFILISGVVFSMGKQPIKRGLILLGWGCVLTLVTVILLPDAAIHFGILSFLGSASLIGSLLYPCLKQIQPLRGLFCCSAFLALSWLIPQGYLSAGPYALLKLPDTLYQTSWLYWLGFPDEFFRSADYFPILPWIFLFFLGIFLGEIFRRQGIFEWMGKSPPGKLAFLGRHSLCIYLLHQPLLYGLCLVISLSA